MNKHQRDYRRDKVTPAIVRRKHAAIQAYLLPVSAQILRWIPGFILAPRNKVEKTIDSSRISPGHRWIGHRSNGRVKISRQAQSDKSKTSQHRYQFRKNFSGPNCK